MPVLYLCKLTEGSHARDEDGVKVRYRKGEKILLTEKEFSSPLLKGRLEIIKKSEVKEERREKEEEAIEGAEVEQEEEEEEEKKEEEEVEVEKPHEPEPDPPSRLGKRLLGRTRR